MLKISLLMTSVMAIALVANELDAVRAPVGGATVVNTAGNELTAVGEVLLVNGVTVSAGDPIYVDDVIEIGIVRNDGDTPVLVLGANGDWVDIPPGGTLRSRCSDCCSTEGCKAGKHACCYWTQAGCARCTCVTDGKLPAPGIGCSSGGGTGCMMCTPKASTDPDPEPTR